MDRRSRVVSVATRAGKTPGAFGDFEEDEPVHPEVLGDDDVPTASGEFASKLSLELRARGMDANGDGAAEPTVPDDAPALDAPGLIARMRANRPGASPSLPSRRRRTGCLRARRLRDPLVLTGRVRVVLVRDRTRRSRARARRRRLRATPRARRRV